MHRTTIVLSDDLWRLMRMLAHYTNGSVGELLSIAAERTFREAFPEMPLKAGFASAPNLASWHQVVQKRRFARDRRFRWNRGG